MLLGAGLDTFAHRNPYPRLRVFEVDHPATQQWKRELLAAGEVAHPANLTYAPVDFERQALAGATSGCGLRSGGSDVFCVARSRSLPDARGVSLDDWLLSRRSRRGAGWFWIMVSRARRCPFWRSWRMTRLLREFSWRANRSSSSSLRRRSPAELDGVSQIEDLGSAEINARYFGGRSDNLRMRGSAGRLLSAWV